jgi:hypothetical protein
MDFVERIFQISPDGGNGVTELTIALAIFCIFALIASRVVSTRLNKPNGESASPR